MCIRVYTNVFLCIPVFTRIYKCTYRVYLCLLVYTYVYMCIHVYTSVYLCIAVFTRVYKMSTAFSIAFPLTHIFNLSLSSGIFPSDWKLSYIVPIPKTTSPSSSPSDYRPISLPIISKVLERHVFNFLSDFCTQHNLLSNSQYGFRSGFSTVCALLSVTNDWFSLLDSHNSVCAVFFDLRKAFDSVPHQLLLDTLSSSGIPPHLFLWLRNYLSNRSQKVVVHGSSSHTSHVLSGVPQGSILGPLLLSSILMASVTFLSLLLN